MKFKTKNVIIALLFISALCLACIAGFFFGKASSQDKLLKERELLYGLNRASIENMSVEGDKVYVIGHMSPDSDTVCSAITFANLLNELGYPAEAAVTDAPNKETAYILKEAGVKTPPVLKDASGKSIFLVDHSEYAQAAPGMADAHIVGIIDHHGIGSVTTGYQVVYEAKPIGATATIIMLDYMNYGVEIDKTNAYLLLCALLSDTENLTGTTVTESDRQALKILANLAGVSDTDALYLAIHTEKLSYEGMTDREIFFSDYKEYESSGYKYGIGAMNVIDMESAKALANRMKEVMPECMSERGVDMMFASVGMRENGEKIDSIVPADEFSREMFALAFPNYDEYDGTSFIFKTGHGRKSKFVPGFTEFLSKHPKE